MPRDASTDPLERFVELAVYAPIGAAAVARERLPEYVATGRERVEQRLVLARFIGQMVVQQGRREIERRLAAGTRPAAAPGPAETTRRAGTETATTAPRASRAETSTPGPTTSVAIQAGDLAIDEYESLSASQVVARLPGLDRSALDAVEAFERAHRNRRTIVNRIAQLRTAT